jgi:hypothetical protein
LGLPPGMQNRKNHETQFLINPMRMDGIKKKTIKKESKTKQIEIKRIKIKFDIKIK